MFRKRERLVKSSLALCQIILLVSFSFALSFLLSDNFVTATNPSGFKAPQGTINPPPPVTNIPPGSLSGATLSQSTIVSSTEYSFSSPATFTTAINGAPKGIVLSGYKANVLAGGQKELVGITTDGKEISGLTQSQIDSIQSSGIDVTEKTSTGTESGGFLDKIFGPQPLGIQGVAGHLISGLIWGAVAFGAVKLIGGFLGLNEKTTNAAAIAAFGGVASFRILQLKVLGQGLSKFALPIGIGIGAAIFVLLYKKESKKAITFTCMPWEPPIGGSKCEECNKDPFRPCSEYRCKSLGQACELVNKGTDKELCTWVNRNDVTSPTITPWNDALKPVELGMAYTPDNAIRPPNRGVKIVKSGTPNGCLPAFTPLEFGITNNEPAQCKIDFDRNATFDNMQYFFGENNYFAYNHTEKIRLPGPDTIGGGVNSSVSPVLKNDGSFSLYVRCQDANGNVNVDAFVFNYCVDAGPDTTPPIIEGFSILDKSPVQFGANEVPIELYVNEPAQCKWSRMNKAYDDMENTMQCATESFQINAAQTFTCSGKLSGIKDREDNKFYFRCKDQPDKADSERNVNVQSKELTLKGSQPLNIIKTEPNETIYGTADVVPVVLKVKTDDGAEEGKAICYFATINVSDSYVAMFDTNKFESTQQLDLTAGNYKYFFRCIDAGGNAAESQTAFTVFLDRTAPKVTRVYHDATDDALKVVTDEDASCAYSIQSCNFVFGEGIKMIYSNPSIANSHFAQWKETQSYYVKCKDKYGNEPSPNECSVVAKASQL